MNLRHSCFSQVRRIVCPAAVMCVISCHAADTNFVHDIVECHQANRLMDTSLGVLSFAEQTIGLQARTAVGQSDLEVFYRAEISIELTEKAKGYEIVIPYDIRIQTSPGASGKVISASRVVLEPHDPWTDAAATIDFASSVDGGVMFEDGKACDSFAIQLGEPSLL